MLKIIYSETGIHLELIAVNHKQWIAERLKFAQSVGEPMQFDRQRATFLVPSPLCEVTNIDANLRNLGANTVTVNQCDLDYVEVELSGYWLSSQHDTPFPLKEYRKGYNYERREEKMNESEPKITISRTR